MPEIRLIGSDGSQLGVFQTRDALKKAEDEGLDLVEISPTAKPPVCKIMDFGKYKYEQAKKKKDQRKHQVVVLLKEVKMRPSTGEHDLDVKKNRIKGFLESGHKVKITIQFRGREMAHKDLGKKLLDRVVKDVEAWGIPEYSPKFEGRFLSAVLQPSKPKATKGRTPPKTANKVPSAAKPKAKPAKDESLQTEQTQ